MLAGDLGGLGLDESESGTPTVFQEPGPQTLDADLSVEEYALDTWIRADDHDGVVLPEGTRLCSWFVHFDGVTDPESAAMRIIFDDPVLALAPRRSDLQNSDMFEHPEVDYGDRYDGLGDTDWIRQGTHSVELDLSTSSRDQLRIFTAC